MAIKKITNENGKDSFNINVVAKSSINRSIRVRKSKEHIDTYVDAQRIEAKLRREAQRELYEKESRGLLWKDLIESWELDARNGHFCIRNIGASTVRDYVSVLLIYTVDWLHKPAKDIDKQLAWSLLHKVEVDVSKARQKRLRSAIDAIFKWAYLSGKLKGSQHLPTEGFSSTVRDEDKKPEILSKVEIIQLLKSAKMLNNPWYPIWAMALLTGMRSGELFALNWDKVDLEAKMIYVHENWTNKTGIGPTKGRYWRAVPISSDLDLLMKELKLKTFKTGFVLPRLQSWGDGRQAELLRAFCIGIGIESVKFHTLRSCFATQLIRDGQAPAVLMKICGWKDLKTMQRYIRLSGIEVQGATEGLKIMPEEQVMERVVELFKS